MQNLSVKVIQGIVKGCRQKLPNGKNYLRFSGIPYAKKPINEQKFKSPQKLLKFDSNEIDCTKEGSECFQKAMFSKQIVGSEDCLYLNVYVPEKSNSSKLAVMVFIHGGGFRGGSSNIQWYSPEYLLMEDVIVVTMNYRLHALGFLYLPSMGISGNAGLKDQQMALEWVYENISSFNGDPDNICLFGQSAGAASVHYHILNKKSRSFIKSAICQSGCALADWALQRNPLEKTKKLAALLGCSNIDDDREIYKTLMEAPLGKLLECSDLSGNSDEERRNLKYYLSPCIEDPSIDAFLVKSPTELIKEEDIRIPVMFGTTDKDGMLETLPKLLASMDSMMNDPVKMLPMTLNINPNSEEAKDLALEVKKLYFGDKPVGMDLAQNYFDLITDIRFLVFQTLSNDLHTKYQLNSKQYLYEFRYDGEINLFKEMLGLKDFKGATHIDDIFYLFGHENFKPDLSENSPALKMKSLMCKLWTNFAKYQNPTPTFDNPINIVWNPSKGIECQGKMDNLEYLIIDTECKMQKNINFERMKFWRKIFKTWNKELSD